MQKWIADQHLLSCENLPALLAVPLMFLYKAPKSCDLSMSISFQGIELKVQKMYSKSERSTWRDGKRRKSPRFTAMDPCKKSQCSSDGKLCLEDCGDCKGPPSRTRTRIKQKPDETLSSAVPIETKQGGEGQYHKDQPSSGNPIQLPKKHVLELILDALQRRDINELFAEPVDPSKVEDYYELVKEPMDFGTMRAKLHEGMYQNLEQFEHDVFLIPTNAMHFNSTGSIYYRQARSIYELAKKVFHVLKTDPENVELEFSGTRRRSIRKATGDTKTSTKSLDPIAFLNRDTSSKDIRASSSGPSVSKSSKGSQVVDMAAANIKRKHYGSYAVGGRKNRRPQCIESDRRCTYRPWRNPFDNDNGSERSAVSWNPRPQILTNQKDISYSESLMLFVKDLGPTAQIIAKKKLEGWPENSATCQAPSSNSLIQDPQGQASTAFETGSWRFPDSLPGCSSTLRTATGTINLTGSKDGHEAFRNSQTRSHQAMAYRNTEMKRYSKSASKTEKVTQKCKSSESQGGFNTSDSGTGDFYYSVVREKSAGTRVPQPKADTSRLSDSVLPVVLALEHTGPDASELKSRNKKNSTEALWPSMTKMVASDKGKLHSGNAVSAPRPTEDGVMSWSHPSLCSESKKSGEVRSGFAFDLPFLKSQLNEMNQDGFSKVICQRAMGSKTIASVDHYRHGHPEPSAKHFVYNQNQLWPLPTSPLGPNLALGL